MERRRENRREADSKYVREMGKTLRLKDVSALREFLIRCANERNDTGEAAEIQGIPEDVLEARMRKMIMARKDLADIHEESRQWLLSHGYKVFDSQQATDKSPKQR